MDIKLDDLLCAGVRVREFTFACVCACVRVGECVTAGMRENVNGDGCAVRKQTRYWPIVFAILEYKCKQRTFIVRTATYNWSGTRASAKRS